MNQFNNNKVKRNIQGILFSKIPQNNLTLFVGLAGPNPRVYYDIIKRYTKAKKIVLLDKRRYLYTKEQLDGIQIENKDLVKYLKTVDQVLYPNIHVDADFCGTVTSNINTLLEIITILKKFRQATLTYTFCKGRTGNSNEAMVKTFKKYLGKEFSLVKIEKGKSKLIGQNIWEYNDHSPMLSGYISNEEIQKMNTFETESVIEKPLCAEDILNTLPEIFEAKYFTIELAKKKQITSKNMPYNLLEDYIKEGKIERIHKGTYKKLNKETTSMSEPMNTNNECIVDCTSTIDKLKSLVHKYKDDKDIIDLLIDKVYEEGITQGMITYLQFNTH